MSSPPPDRGANVRVPPPLVFIGTTLVGVAVHALGVRLRLPVDRGVTLVVGVLLAIGGLALAAAARNLFVRSGQNPAPWTPSPELIGAGPYRFTRNPMYVGLTTLQIGLGIALNVLWISVLAPGALVIVHVVAVTKEEAYLTAKFGDRYTAYCARVRRYL